MEESGGDIIGVKSEVFLCLLQYFLRKFLVNLEQKEAAIIDFYVVKNFVFNCKLLEQRRKFLHILGELVFGSEGVGLQYFLEGFLLGVWEAEVLELDEEGEVVVEESDFFEFSGAEVLVGEFVEIFFEEGGGDVVEVEEGFLVGFLDDQVVAGDFGDLGQEVLLVFLVAVEEEVFGFQLFLEVFLFEQGFVGFLDQVLDFFRVLRVVVQLQTESFEVFS
ncbi:hypothetical protein PPERSA_01493 [Pseudocohnilembus persalinus]|uniref:Uncharacterized protein n=1 Tax=Pseudocohnilembus persalinus TaxID=266149 RepID=A0A0V0QHF1_PSEPJ|nr:hypothetical protein PPERSA_01493 [Pseudocohnilembus persalinus]|eukprot:KRX01590.1 hypothetical protein PPERSA_01493 [Pseudocohnilembus persalinus]